MFFEHLLGILDEDGIRHIAMFDAFFDESMSGDGTKLMSMAGIILDPDHRLALNREWKELIKGKPYYLDEFHMTDCANNAPPYDRLGRPRCDSLARKLIRLIQAHGACAIAVSVSEFEYKSAAMRISEKTGIDWLGSFGGPYTLLTQCCMEQVAKWADDSHYTGDIAYFFEEGHDMQQEASFYLDIVARDPERNKRFRRASHTFAPKKGPNGLQSGGVAVPVPVPLRASSV